MLLGLFLFRIFVFAFPLSYSLFRLCYPPLPARIMSHTTLAFSHYFVVVVWNLRGDGKETGL